MLFYSNCGLWATCRPQTASQWPSLWPFEEGGDKLVE